MRLRRSTRPGRDARLQNCARPPPGCYCGSLVVQRRAVWFIVVFAIGCTGVRSSPGPAVPTSPAPAPPPPVYAPPAPPPSGLQPLAQAVKDALSGPLVHIGTGPWPGNHRAHACAYRNDRVIVVNVYCTLKETKAFRVDLLSPVHGRVRIYAEASAPISTVRRPDYFTFTGEVQPSPPPGSGIPPLAFTMSFPDLQAYEERRYAQFLPTCFGGVEIHRPQGGCLRDLESQAAEWARTNGPFLENPPEEWYRLVGELRALASLHGRSME